MQTGIVQAQEELHELEYASQNTPDPYGQLKARTEELQALVSSCRIAVAPHDKLPPELLVEIFHTCSALPSPSILPPKPNDILLVLTQVCRAWRELVLHLPELWASISLSFTDPDSLDVQRLTRITEEWISRASSGALLCITVDCSLPCAIAVHEAPDLLSGFMADVILTNASRLKHLELTLPSNTLRPLFDLPNNSCSHLEILRLRPQLFDDHFGLPDDAEPQVGVWQWPNRVAALNSAVALREVVFHPTTGRRTLSEMIEAEGQDVIDDIMDRGTVESAPLWYAPTISLPWTHLRVLHFPLTACTPDVWCSILAECPKLEQSYLAVRPGPTPVSGAQIHLESLQELYLFAWEGAGEVLLASLTTPNLTQFLIQGQLSPAAFADFRIRSAFTLDMFSMLVNIASADVEPLFAQLSDVGVLLILFMSTEHFPEDVWARISRGELLPQLRFLVLTPRPAQMPVLVEAIATNWDLAKTDENRCALKVRFLNVASNQLSAVTEALGPLDQHSERETRLDFLTI